MQDLLENLNPAQLEAVTSTEGFIRVIAGAGSGKTRALSHRFAYLVNELGILPGNILCVTFTNKAANEMKKRIRTMIGDSDTGFVCTFHGFCVQLLREDIHAINYPQNFASQGLLPKADQTTPLANDSIYSLFPVERMATESVADYLRRAVSTDSVNKSVADYYLSSLLLDRHLDEFVANLPEYYNITDDTLPRHYKEAVALYSDVACDSTIAVDEAVMEKYTDLPEVDTFGQALSTIKSFRDFL